MTPDHQIPDGFVAVALSQATAAAPLHLAVLVRKHPDPVAGHFVILRDTVDARIYLGCLIDAAGIVHEWLEIWVQTQENLAASPPGVREALLNPILDQRWQRHAAAFDQLDPTLIYHAGWESAHPLPLFIDTAKMAPLHPTEALQNRPLVLCQDDARLAKKNLPAFSKSLHRYLYVPEDDSAPLIPITPDAPANSNTVTTEEITGPNPALVPLNPAGGLMLCRAVSPIPLEAFLDLLSGGGWDGLISGKSNVHVDQLAAVVADEANAGAEGRLFMGQHGRHGRFVEHFHLKLRLLHDAVWSVRTMTAATQRPLLNITAESFRIRLGQVGRGLPFLWTAQATLIDPGDAVSFAFESADAQYFLRAAAAPAMVYQPAAVTKPAQGRCSLRIRRIISEAAGAIIEGTVATQERLSESGGPTRNDLLWLRLPLGAGRVDLYAHMEHDAALAAGEWRFRTTRQRFADATLAQLKAAEGAPVGDVSFEIIPLLSSPCDLYSLAMLAIRTLLVNPATTLPVAVDEVLSLARQVAAEHNDQPLRERIRAIFQRDRRFVDALGPHRLVRDAISAQEAFDLVPPELWLDALGLIIRMLPGIGPDSVCRDFGDARAGGLHKVFDPSLAELDTLLRRSRSLIVIDWRFNREIHAILRGLSEDAPGKTRV